MKKIYEDPDVVITVIEDIITNEVEPPSDGNWGELG